MWSWLYIWFKLLLKNEFSSYFLRIIWCYFLIYLVISFNFLFINQRLRLILRKIIIRLREINSLLFLLNILIFVKILIVFFSFYWNLLHFIFILCIYWLIRRMDDNLRLFWLLIEAWIYCRLWNYGDWWDWVRLRIFLIEYTFESRTFFILLLF